MMGFAPADCTGCCSHIGCNKAAQHMQVSSDVLHLQGPPAVDELDERGALVGGGHRRQRRQDAAALRADILHTWCATKYMGTSCDWVLNGSAWSG